MFRLSCRQVGPAPLPVWLSGLGCLVGWIGTFARLVCSGPPTYMLFLCDFPCACKDSTNILVGSIRQPG